MVKETGFYALLSRMRYISRWGLMRSSIPENVQEHSHETAVYAHALGIIRREIFGQECDAERLAVLAVYHDASEILTGDLPTPIKYHDRTLRDAYKKVEHAADERLLAMLPEELRGAYADRFAVTLINNRKLSPGAFEQRENGAVLLGEAGRKTVISAWQEKKRETITHPFLEEKMPWGLVPHVQALLLARCLRGDIDEYPPFLWK